jgi:hypothetical protein
VIRWENELCAIAKLNNAEHVGGFGAGGVAGDDIALPSGELGKEFQTIGFACACYALPRDELIAAGGGF